MARMPSPSKISPSPRRSSATSLAKERSISRSSRAFSPAGDGNLRVAGASNREGRAAGAPCVLRQAQDEVLSSWQLRNAILTFPHPEPVEGRTKGLAQTTDAGPCFAGGWRPRERGYRDWRSTASLRSCDQDISTHRQDKARR